jgi:(1->4)-alpha-D-glucan 1-alpha-D-glucosylmutase
VPSPAEEYLFFQTVLGAWPGGATPERAFVERVRGYLNKALLEAKLNTSWINRNERYEEAVSRYVEAALDPERSRAFLEDFARFYARVVRPGYFTSLAQLVLKVAVPGVPDFYQGTELWDLSLVDPDNRRPVDWSRRRAHLDALLAEGQRDPRALCDRLLSQPEDGRIKLYVTARALHFRRAQRALFERGDYQELASAGGRAQHLVAFARSNGARVALAVVGRHFARLCEGDALPVGPAWQDTQLLLPESLAGHSFRDVFSGRVVGARDGALPVAEVLTHLPVALLEAIS